MCTMYSTCRGLRTTLWNNFPFKWVLWIELSFPGFQHLCLLNLGSPCPGNSQLAWLQLWPHFERWLLGISPSFKSCLHRYTSLGVTPVYPKAIGHILECSVLQQLSWRLSWSETVSPSPALPTGAGLHCVQWLCPDFALLELGV